MDALTLLIIRHAEKPDGDATGPGLTHLGKPDAKSLVISGWERAGAWTALFGAGLGGTTYPAPQAVYAADPDSTKDGSEPSRRPYETVLELAARVGLAKPNTSFAKGQEAALVEALLPLSGTVLVAWEHKAIISDILPRLPVTNTGDLPTHWSGKRFDVVLRFDRAAGEIDFTFTELFPCLMPGDSNKPLKNDPIDE
ncbi:histidine phosphatase family protein [Bradyrhizobium ontarionense]|uniref:Histidine phosphatase family protein n=1 Tax=Bradyrhizobium ontarionense TaxID=2898149 RepID=A0ABY3RDZ2_9BRAD|nr:histidine phosphatase family protein [Bradyrhizobium sp. A19]UFZ05202.1 histidine phosphatase family protein [Bradyrhizobium sp. A19]